MISNMKRFFLSILSIAIVGMAFSQNEILMKVGGESIGKDAFVRAYQKNNELNKATERDLRDYLDLYVNYRLKVQDAKTMMLDTSKAFQRELASYKNQSAQQYLVDTEVSDRLLDEAFERAKLQQRVSHILVNCKDGAAPKDTLAAYHKIMDIREKILAGMDFSEAAFLYSEDPSARDYKNSQNGRMMHGNRGELGYFSVLEMIYPFESGAYNTPVGQVSMPVRSQYGYHLIYVWERIPAIAQVYVSQIFLKDTSAMFGNENPDIKAKIREINRRLNDGSSSFEDLAREFSEDKATKDNGGVMAPFTPNKRPGNYVAAAIHLQPGQVSDPVATSMGWHILKLDSIKYVNMNDEAKFMLKSRLSHDPRAHKSKESLIAKLKKEYNYREDGKKAAMKFFKKNIPSTFFSSTRVNIDSLNGIDDLKPMCTFATQSLSAKDFGYFFARYQGVQLKGTVVDFLEEVFPTFVGNNIIRYEQAHLEEKYPEYKDLVDEFHDGMLLFEINSQKVWNAAVKDSVGLANYYEQIKTQFPTTDSTGAEGYKPMSEVRAQVINQYQDSLEKQWLKELHEKYPVSIDEKVFRSILKK